MKKYVCSVCGYVYDEAKGDPESAVAPGTAWEDVPGDWVCPLCGAAKDAFEEQGESNPPTEDKPALTMETSVEMKELTPLEVSVICSNLARGCEKQYKAEESEMFKELSERFKAASPPAKEPSLDKLLELIEHDLKEGLPIANQVASDQGDRGALRALTWNGKVTRILKSLINRYQKEGDAMLENTGVFVCTICGFIYIGDAPPELCPICKVADWKFEKIEGGNENG